MAGESEHILQIIRTIIAILGVILMAMLIWAAIKRVLSLKKLEKSLVSVEVNNRHYKASFKTYGLDTIQCHLYESNIENEKDQEPLSVSEQVIDIHRKPEEVADYAGMVEKAVTYYKEEERIKREKEMRLINKRKKWEKMQVK